VIDHIRYGKHKSQFPENKNKQQNRIAKEPPRSGKVMCHHVLESGLQKAVKRAGIDKCVTCHTLRHGLTQMLEHGINIRRLQELLGHTNVKTTEK